MVNDKTELIYEELHIGNEQVTSNECWDAEDADEPVSAVYADLNLGEEQVTSNECYDAEEEDDYGLARSKESTSVERTDKSNSAY